MNYETALPYELEKEIAKTPVVYLPWGAHEWHGVHNPAGLDGIKARFLAERLAGEVGGVVFPAVFCGHSTVAEIGMPYSMEFGADTIVALTRDYLSQLSKMGFKLIVIILGHWGQRQGGIVKSVAAEFNNSQSSALVWAVQEDEIIEIKEDHGGAFETSLIMACRPGAVDLSRLPGRELGFKEDGVIGEDPRKNSSEERGHKIADEYALKAGEIIRELLKNL